MAFCLVQGALCTFLQLYMLACPDEGVSFNRMLFSRDNGKKECLGTSKS